jgi:hypothetical protein
MTAWEKWARGCGSRAKATAKKIPPPTLSSARNWPRNSRRWLCQQADQCACGCWMKCATACMASPGGSGACQTSGRSCQTQQKYQWGFVDGAVGVGLSRAEFLLTETMDQPHTQQFYRQIGQSDPAAVHVLIQDGAGFSFAGWRCPPAGQRADYHPAGLQSGVKPDRGLVGSGERTACATRCSPPWPNSKLSYATNSNASGGTPTGFAPLFSTGCRIKQTLPLQPLYYTINVISISPKS